MDHNDAQQHHNRDTAQHTQIFAHTGEDKVRMLTGEDSSGMSLLHAGETAGSKGQLTLGGLPGDAIAGGVNAGVIGSDKALLLIVLQKVGPQQRDRCRHRCAAHAEPVHLDACCKEHCKKDEKNDKAGTKVRGDDNDGAENHHKVAYHLHDGGEGIDIVVFLEPCHMPCADDYVDYLDKLRGLYTDTGKTNPRLVAGAVVLTEDDQCDKQGDDDAPQKLPLLAQQVSVNNGKDHERADTNEYRKALNCNIFGGGRHIPAAGSHTDNSRTHHYKAKERAESAHHQQENIRPLKEILDPKFDFIYLSHRLSAAYKNFISFKTD